MKTVINITRASFAAVEALREGCWVDELPDSLHFLVDAFIVQFTHEIKGCPGGSFSIFSTAATVWGEKSVMN